MATDIRIDSLLPSPGAAFPLADYDGTSGIAYTLWELNDEARFSFTVPDSYLDGSNLILKIQEASPTASKNHKWQAACTLVRPGVDTVDAVGEAETFTTQWTSPSTAGQVTVRSLSICTSGQISLTDVTDGDIVSVVLTRIAAATNEDSASIRVLGISVSASVDTLATVGDCSGDVGKVVAEVLLLANDDLHQDFTKSALVVTWVNACTRKIAEDGYWTKDTAIDVVADQASYSLLTLIPDLQRIDSIRWTSTNYPMIPVATRVQLEALKRQWSLYAQNASEYAPYYYFIHGNQLMISPVPATSVTGGWTVTHSYLPGDLDCSDNTDLPVPVMYRSVYVNYCLAQNAGRDRGGKTAQADFKKYYGMFNEGRYSMIADGMTAGGTLGIRPGDGR